MTDELGLQFIDTNVLVYAHDRTAGEKHEIAKSLIQNLWDTESGCLSIQVLQEFYVISTQKVAQPLDPKSATRIIRDLSHWKVHSPNVEDILGAINLQNRYQVSFWDAMILWSAN
jgi:predicted nucleic acid-binding protein